MKYLIYLMVIVATSCSSWSRSGRRAEMKKQVKDTTTTIKVYEPKKIAGTLEIIEIDKHEYVLYRTPSGAAMVHHEGCHSRIKF
jgi:hypothetical protein